MVLRSPQTNKCDIASIIISPAQDTNFDVRASVNTEGGDTAISIPTQRSLISSVGGESLQEIWKMLDEGRPSPTPRLSSPHRAARGQGNALYCS